MSKYRAAGIAAAIAYVNTWAAFWLGGGKLFTAMAGLVTLLSVSLALAAAAFLLAALSEDV